MMIDGGVGREIRMSKGAGPTLWLDPKANVL